MSAGLFSALFVIVLGGLILAAGWWVLTNDRRR